MSMRQACRLSRVHRSTYCYRRKCTLDDHYWIEQLRKLAEEHPRYGFWKMYKRLRNQGECCNHKKLYRIYKSLKLNLKRAYKRRLPKRVAEPLQEPDKANEVWSLDFMSDSLSNGRYFRILNIIDDYNRELCWLQIGLSIPAESVVEALDHLIKERGKPKRLRVDNGPEFTSQRVQDYCQQQAIELKYIQPGRPMQNAYIERFNRSYRTEILDSYLFHTLDQVKSISYDWAEDYNHNRPHDSLDGQSPIAYAQANPINRL